MYVLTPSFARYFLTLYCVAAQKGLQMHWEGATYPNQDSKRQAFTLKLLCEPDTQAGPVFKSYDGETAIVEWTHQLACPYKYGQEPPSHEKPSESVGSSLGWFFLVYVPPYAPYHWSAYNLSVGCSLLLPLTLGWARTTIMLHMVPQATI